MKKLIAILFLVAGFAFASTAMTTQISTADFGIEKPIDKKPKKKKNKKGAECTTEKAASSSCCSHKAAACGSTSATKGK